MARFERLSVSEITTLHASFEDDVATYAAAGLGGIGVWESKLGDRDRSSAAALIADAGLRVTNLVPLGNSIFPTALSPAPTDPGRRTDELLARVEPLAGLRPETIVVVTGVCPAAPAEATRERCVHELRRVVRRARELGLTVALEPMHPSAAPHFSFIDSLAAAAELLAAIGERGAGLLYDTWHMGQSADAVDALRAHVGLVAGVHVADVHTPTRSWADRAFPGEGELPLEALLATLEAGGFTGSYDVEIFSDDGSFGERFDDSLWTLPAPRCIERATALLRRILPADHQPSRSQGG